MTLLLAAFDPPYWLSTLIKVLVVSVVVPTTALILGMVFLFKVMSWMQSRLGPQDAGPRGTLQLLADGVKFLQKEDIAPNGADMFIFKVAPLVVLMSTLLLYVALPASTHLVISDLDVGVFYVLAVSSLSVIGVLMAGWASANKYSLMGGLRAAGQLIAYELPMVLATLGVVIQAGTLSLNGIVFSQADGTIFGWSGIGNPFILTQFVGFVIFIAAVQAELTQPPFDMPVAESEIVSRLPGRVHRLPVPDLLPGRVRHGVRVRRHRLDPLPRGLGGPVARDRQRLVLRARPGGALRQGDGRLVHHLLGPLHVPPLP